jgi:hypothetical protein
MYPCLPMLTMFAHAHLKLTQLALFLATCHGGAEPLTSDFIVLHALAPRMCSASCVRAGWRGLWIAHSGWPRCRRHSSERLVCAAVCVRRAELGINVSCFSWQASGRAGRTLFLCNRFFVPWALHKSGLLLALGLGLCARVAVLYAFVPDIAVVSC